MGAWRGTGIAFGAALPGAALLHWAGVPAGALLGATLATAVCALARMGPVVPDTLRNAAFAVIGLSLGAGITADLWSDIARWPLSLAGLTLTMIAIMAVSGLMLTRVFRLDPVTATLSASPGALSYAVAIAGEGAGDLRAVVALQSLRLLLVTLCLPPLIAALAGVDGLSAATAGAAPVGLALCAVLVAAAMLAGRVMDRLRLPAAYLLAGLFVSGGAHYAEWVHGPLDYPLIFAGFAVTGAVIGSRFTRIARADLIRLAGAGVAMTAVSVAISAIGAAAVSGVTGLAFPTVWVAFAPGGVEGMAAIGLALGLDPAYVATHHIFRIVLVIAALVVALRMARR